jgi:photosystem II stability/assembly factor-like uncharacterized protein
MKTHRYRLFLATLGVALALLAGCATSPPPISQAQTLSGQEGAVVIRLITNGADANDPTETLSSLTLKRDVAPGVQASAEDTAILRRTREMTNSTAVFSGMVAPGRYRLSHATGFFANITYTFPLAGRLGSFEVKPREVSLLGTLLVQPQPGKRFQIGYLAPDAELAHTVKTLFPALAEQTRGQEPNQFEATPQLAFSASLAPAFRNLTTALNGVETTADGSLLAGSKMGRVIWRKPGEERASALQIDTWLEVLSVRPYRQGLLAAGEEGLLRFSADAGKTWQALPAPAAGMIAAAEPLASGKVLALVRRGTQWQALLSDDPFTGPWRPLATFAQENSINMPWQNAMVLAGRDRAGVFMPNGEFLVVDGNTGALERRSIGVTTSGAQLLADGTLLAQGGNLTRSTYVSTDGGRQWRDLDTSRFVTAITATNAQTYYAVAPIEPGIFAGAYALMVSRDGAKSWKKAGEVPGGDPAQVRSLQVDRQSGALLAVLSQGRVMRSADEGVNWTRVR